MLTDSERFAFRTHRAHVLETTGNAYDACQVDEAIDKGHTLIVLGEGVVGLAWAWPVAVTAEAGHLHKIADAGAATLIDLVAPLGFDEDDVRTAISLARALGFAIDPAFDRVCPTE
ncbi:hypothetical protein [Novosphingobium sp.]|uniref:hypothetical protein n=1 Tax=Novosphingobium sp. TaxID=1874826 RepID=UPI0038B77DAC